MEKLYDIIIVGGGPAGLTAGIYACRNNLQTLLIEEFACGGQILNTYEIKNFSGFENISGTELSEKMEVQAKKLGLEIVYQKVIDYDFSQQIKVVKTAKTEYKAKAVILSMGAKPKELGIENENNYIGRGVSYCAICDGGFFKDKVVAIVGGGNSAMEDVAYLTNIAKKTYLINRSEKYRALPTLVSTMRKLESQNKITVLENTVVTNLLCDNKLNAIKLSNVKTGEQSQIEVDGLFIEIGRAPNTDIVKKYIKIDEYGYIVADANLMTSEPGVFVAGDIRQKNLRQIITACSDGAIASTNALNYISANVYEEESSFSSKE